MFKIWSGRKKDICGHRSLVKFSISLCRVSLKFPSYLIWCTEYDWTVQQWVRLSLCNILEYCPIVRRYMTVSGSLSYVCSWFCVHLFVQGYKANVRAFAGQKQKKSLKRLVKIRKGKNIQPDESVSLEIESASRDDRVQDDILTSSSDNLEVQNSFAGVPSRNAVLQACTVTSSLIGALGILIRQVHFSVWTSQGIVDIIHFLIALADSMNH